MWEERWQFGVGGGRSGEFTGEDLPEERIKRHLGESRPGQCREPASGSIASASGTEWMRHREEKGGEGQGGPGVCRLWDLCKTLGFYSEWDGKLKEPAFTTPALARQSPEDREKNSPLPGAPRAVQCPPTNSDLHCRTGPPTSTRGWTGTLCLTCMLCSDEDLLHTGD